jgi:hypothetical protein
MKEDRDNANARMHGSMLGVVKRYQVFPLNGEGRNRYRCDERERKGMTTGQGVFSNVHFLTMLI